MVDPFDYYLRLTRVREVVEGQLLKGTATCLGVAARVAGMERTAFSRFFHEETGNTYRSWHVRLQIDRATGLIRTRNHTLTEVSSLSGFREYRTFLRHFKQVEGQTPSAYKKTVRGRAQGGFRMSIPE